MVRLGAVDLVGDLESLELVRRHSCLLLIPEAHERSQIAEVAAVVDTADHVVLDRASEFC